jgi:hypothetical protein
MIEKKTTDCVKCVHVAVCAHVAEFKVLSDQAEGVSHSPLFKVVVMCMEHKHYGGIPRGGE